MSSRLLLQSDPATSKPSTVLRSAVEGGGNGPARPEDYTLSHVDSSYVDLALTDLAAKLERNGYRGKAHEVRELCAKFFNGFDTIIRDVQGGNNAV